MAALSKSMDIDVLLSQSSTAPGESSSEGSLRRPRTSPAINVTLEAQQDLRQFLSIVRPQWLEPRRGGQSDMGRVLGKLQQIGIGDTGELIQRTTDNRINQDLTAVSRTRFSRNTIEGIRRQGTFIRALDSLNEANVRQTGIFAPVPQMLSHKNLWYQASQSKTSSRAASDGGCGGKSRFQAVYESPESWGGTSSAKLIEGVRRHRPINLDTLDSTGSGSDGLAMSSSSGAVRLRTSKTTLGNRASLRTPGGSSMNKPGSAPGATRSLCGQLLAESRAPTPSSPGSDAGGRARQRANTDTTSPASESNSPTRMRADSVRDRSASQDALLLSRRRDHSPSDAFDRTPVSEETLVREAEKMQKEGRVMQEEGRMACWRTLNKNSLLQHGEAILKEQSALEEKGHLYRAMQTEGLGSPLRRHVARNIRSHLKEEDLQSVKQGRLDVEQRCINIRKDLTAMMNARRELCLLRRSAFETEDCQE